ncbi:hypothetical protein NKR23_g1285 [Pleurostoma richardsiae]|uniref:Uncharacterized protein n=1 Tax=Pleurostoma richardsiae TaxID=41990 RepID=A0AA38VWK5_9PEZI|nr:hypothetical protein NKR23_g1285 [Pleurostoma richardsiae]
MFEHYTFGTQVHTAAASGDEDLEIEPKDKSHCLQHPSSITEPDIPYNEADRYPPKPKRASVDSITQKLSDQHLRLVDELYASRPLQPLSFPCNSEQLEFSPALEVDDEPDRPLSPLETMPHGFTSSLSSQRPIVSPPEEYVLKASEDSRRVMRKINAQFNNNPVNVKAVHSLVEDMIATGNQCNVYSTTPVTPQAAEPDNADRMDLESDTLEVDDANCEEGLVDDSALENLVSLRHASMPNGIRKHGPLRFRTSADIALRCPNVVRSVPRMRRRRKQEHKASLRPLPADGAASSRGPE